MNAPPIQPQMSYMGGATQGQYGTVPSSSPTQGSTPYNPSQQNPYGADYNAAAYGQGVNPNSPYGPPAGYPTPGYNAPPNAYNGPDGNQMAMNQQPMVSPTNPAVAAWAAQQQEQQGRYSQDVSVYSQPNYTQQQPQYSQNQQSNELPNPYGAPATHNSFHASNNNNYGLPIPTGSPAPSSANYPQQQPQYAPYPSQSPPPASSYSGNTPAAGLSEKARYIANQATQDAPAYNQPAGQLHDDEITRIAAQVAANMRGGPSASSAPMYDLENDPATHAANLRDAAGGRSDAPPMYDNKS